MRNRNHVMLAALLCLTLAACAPTQVAEEPAEAAAPSYEAVMKLPLSTTSEEAKTNFHQGLEASDLGRFAEARKHFLASVAADPEFATGYLAASSVANSYNDFVGNLKKAGEHSAGASPAEQAWIASFEKGFENDDEGALSEAMKVVELVPDSPRGWLNVALSQAALGNYADERATAQKILADSPAFLPAHFQLANSYLFNEPRDFAKAEANARKMVELAPEEQNSHDILGDVHRAQGHLDEAHAAYTRASELAPDNGSPLQQRGHVNSFLGNWAEARADYDAAMALSEPQVAANFGIWRGLVAVHEGKLEDAVTEFEGMIANVDNKGLEDPLSAKIGYLNNIFLIASHHGMHDEAESAIERNHALRMERIDTSGAEKDRANQQAATVLQEGILAARSGDHALARTKAKEYMALVASNTDPQKDEPAHELLGLADLLEGNHADAIAHFEQGSPVNPYPKYHLALACEAAGDTERATTLFADLAEYNFNAVGYALVRADVLARTAT